MVKLVEHIYSHGTKFWTVECTTCRAVLNSGHHYLENELHHAKSIAFAHVGDCK